MTKDEALRMALEVMHNQGDVSVDEWIATEKAIREALAEQPAQGCEFCKHPLYAGTKCKNCGRDTPAQPDQVSCYCPNCEALSKQLAQLKARTAVQGELVRREQRMFMDEQEFYTTPQPLPERKPLLASDIVTMYDENPRSDSEMIEFARAIEAAHGIKGDA